MDLNERRHFEKMMRDLRFPAYAVRRLDEMYERPGEDYLLRCKTLGIAFPLDASHIDLALKFSALPDGKGFIADSYTASIRHQPSRSIRQHTFPILDVGTRHVDEAFALLDGRSIQRYGRDKDNALTLYWEQFDFMSRDPQGQYRIVRHNDFDLERAMAQLPFSKQLTSGHIKEISEQLHGGEAATVPLKNTQVYLVADPAKKNVLVCNADGKVLDPYNLRPKDSIYNVIQRHFRRRRGRGL